jgi:hypothetical protein
MRLLRKIGFIVLLAAAAVPLRAEIRSIDITIFGMD